LNRAKYLVGSEKITGTFVFYVEEDSPEGKLIYPIIEYTVKDSVFRFKAAEGTSYKLKEKVPVLLENGDPNQPLLFTISSFWLYPLFYWILPFIIWAAFSLSYITRREVVIIDFKYPFFRKGKKDLPRSREDAKTIL
jgi:hypothetical protein